MKSNLLYIAGSLLLVGCANLRDNSAPLQLPRGEEAYQAVPEASPIGAARDYRIGPTDVIDISVFQEPELSPKGVQVDAAGRIELPLVGTIQAAGKTASELSADLAARLGARYLVNPQVGVNVVKAISQRFSVQGEVKEPGLYPLSGRTTLLEAVSLAKGETLVASLDEVVVLRTVEGKQLGAVFDIKQIRRGNAPDPEILGGDVVVVGYSNLKAAWRDVISTAPLIGAFRILGR